MANLPVTLAVRERDCFTPLVMGDVTIEGIDLTLRRTFDALTHVTDDPSVHGGEASFDPDGMAAFIQADMPLGRLGHPEEVARVVAFLASNAASLVLGACVSVDGGQSRSLI